MTNLVKIKNIHLYVGFTANAAECYSAISILKAKNIRYNLLNYSDQVDHHKVTFDAISTWNLGTDNHKLTAKDFPILVWDECYSDWTTVRQAVQGLDDIEDSTVCVHFDLIDQ